MRKKNIHTLYEISTAVRECIINTKPQQVTEEQLNIVTLRQTNHVLYILLPHIKKKKSSAKLQVIVSKTSAFFFT